MRARARVVARIYGMAECMRARGRLQSNLDYHHVLITAHEYTHA